MARLKMRWIVLVVTLKVVSSVVSWSQPRKPDSPAQIESAPLQGKYSDYQTPHYSIEYNTFKQAARQMTEILEHLRRLFFKVFSQSFDLEKPKGKMKVFLFKSENEYRYYVSTKAPQMIGFSGVYNSNEKCLILLDPHASPSYLKAVEDLEVLEHRIEERRRRTEFHNKDRISGKVPSWSSKGQEWR